MPEKKKGEVGRMTDEELAGELKTARDELLDLRFQLATRQLKNVREIRRARRRIARAMTLQHQRETTKSA